MSKVFIWVGKKVQEIFRLNQEDVEALAGLISFGVIFCTIMCAGAFSIICFFLGFGVILDMMFS